MKKKRSKLRLKTLLISIGMGMSVTACGNSGKAAAEIEQATIVAEAATTEIEQTTAAAEEAKMEVDFTDDLGNHVQLSAPQHVAVASGSFAEVWLLAGGKLSAVTDDVNSERELPIEKDVVNLGNFKSPNIEKMIEDDIDFIILSAKIDEHVALQDTLEKAGIATAYFEVETFDEYLSMLKICTDITGQKELYQENGVEVREEIDKQMARADGSEKRVLFIRAFSTGAKAKGSDNMTGAMLKDLGCSNIADSDSSILEELSMERIIEDDPDYIFVTTMGKDEAAAMKSVEEMLLSNPAWKDLTAVKQGRYTVLPKSLFHNKPNNRWGESYTILADILYGEK